MEMQWGGVVEMLTWRGKFFLIGPEVRGSSMA